jgi:hypothetical protein
MAELIEFDELLRLPSLRLLTEAPATAASGPAAKARRPAQAPAARRRPRRR